MRYDCNKSLDLAHEFNRMCHIINPLGITDSCGGCPLFPLKHPCSTIIGLEQRHIDLVQKWSDSHPEMPKLTKKEEWFLDGFCDDRGMTIKRSSQNVLYVCQYTPFGENTIMIDSSMFLFISAGEEWNFQKLFSLEVEE